MTLQNIAKYCPVPAQLQCVTAGFFVFFFFYLSVLIVASVPGCSFIPLSMVLNLYMRYDSRCSRSRFDLNPVSKSVTVNFSNEWPGRLRCFDRGRDGVDFAWARWLLKRIRNGVSVWPIYCKLHTLHSSKYITFEESHVRFPRMLTENFDCVLVALLVSCIALQTRHLGFRQGRHALLGGGAFIADFTSVSLRLRDRRYTTPGEEGKARFRRSLCSRML